MAWRYEILEHTADIGVRAYGDDLGEALAGMALGMMSLIVPEEHRVAAEKERRLEVDADDLEGLLVAWLSEFIYLIYSENFLPAAIEGVQVDGNDTPRGKAGRRAITALVRGEEIDPERRQLQLEIKGVTYHLLKVERARRPVVDGLDEQEGWLAQAILDI